MILEAGLAKLLLAGGGAVSSIALIAGMAGGNTTTQAKLTPAAKTAICAYAEGATTPAVRKTSDLKLGLTRRQLANAQAIVKVADQLKLPERAKLVALSAALQESWLNEKAVGDSGRARGLFQMWPSYGWGTVEQVTNPNYAARKFYSVLVKVRNWEKLSITEAAQAVERSAYPNAYRRHVPLARRIVSALAETPAAAPEVVLTKEEKATARSDIEAAAALGLKKRELVEHFGEALRDKVDKAAARLRGKSATLRWDMVGLSEQAERLVTGIAVDLCAKAAPDKGTSKITGSSDGATALRHAIGKLGVAYSWGGGGVRGESFGIGRGANTKGFDCSGLVEYAWGKAGVRVGGHTSTQWTSGVKVPRSQLKPGDLLFFATNPKDPATIHHVAINIDGKRYVHAPYTGSVVKIGTWTPQREAQFIGAVRPADVR